jgi:hypothetical protein
MFPETSVLTRATWRHIPEDGILHMIIIRHPPYLQNLAPCDSNLFPKLTMKVKGHFETAPDTQRVLQAVVYSIKEHDFLGALKH